MGKHCCVTPEQGSEQGSDEAALQLHKLLRSSPAVHLAASMQDSSPSGNHRLSRGLDVEIEATNRQLGEQQLYDCR